MSASTVFAVAIIFIGALGAYMLYTGQLQQFLPEIVEELDSLDIIDEAESQIGEGMVSLVVNDTSIEYETLVPNPRWNHMPIKVYMDTRSGEELDNFGEDDVEYVRQALKVWEEKTDGVISFEEVDSLSEGEVIVSWFPSLSDIRGGRVVGEGGPTRAIETGGTYTLIEAGEIFLL